MPQIPIDILLIFLLVILVTFLFIRLRTERKRTRFLQKVDIPGLQSILMTNATGKQVHLAAGEITRILKEVFGADRIIYLRNHNNRLELNYFYGIKEFDKRDLRISSPDVFFDHFAGGCFPIKVRILEKILPLKMTELLRIWECDLAFPIIDHRELFGLYFIRCSSDCSFPEFKLLLTSISQSLAVAYRVAEESKLIGGAKKTVKSTHSDQVDDLTNSTGFLKLIGHRNPDTLVGKIVDLIKKELELERVAFIYADRRKSKPTCIQQRGIDCTLSVPQLEVFNDLISYSNEKSPETIDELGNLKKDISQWGDEMQLAGLKYMIPFKLSGDRSGLFMWHDKKDPGKIRRHLIQRASSIKHLVENAESFERVEEMSYTDNLTGLSNRRYFLKRCKEEILRASRHNRPLALVIFDLDDLKGVNDRYGHQAGDLILNQIGSVLKSSVRSIDVVARYGGDEFCIIMPETDRATLNRFMARLQGRITGTKFKIDQFNMELSNSISQGGAVYPDHGTDSDQLIFAADMALLQAKEGGRNRFVIP